MASQVRSGTNQGINPFLFNSTPVSLIQGPSWNTFEEFRCGGSSVLSRIPEGGVATLRTSKSGIFRILRDQDFLRLLGMASEVYRLQQGFRHIRHALEVWIEHPDEKHTQLVMESTEFIAGTPALPEQIGHEPLELLPQERSYEESDDFDVLRDEIPTPNL